MNRNCTRTLFRTRSQEPHSTLRVFRLALMEPLLILLATSVNARNYSYIQNYSYNHNYSSTQYYSYTQNYSYSDYLKTRGMHAAVSLGFITVVSGLASQKPKAAGIGLIALSPFVGASAYARKGALSGLVSTLAVAGLGWYNLDELAKDKYSKTRVFEKDMAVMAGALGIGLLLESSKFLMRFQQTSHLNVIPTNEGLSLNYRYRF